MLILYVTLLSFKQKFMSGFDLTILGMVGLGSFLGLTRGLTGEILSLVKIAISSMLSVFIMQNVQSMMPASGVAQYASNAVVGFVIFFICNIILGLITFQLNFVLSAIVPGIINRPLGVLAGGGKMFILASVIFYIGYSLMLKMEKDDPAWLEGAHSKEILFVSGGSIVGLFVNFDDKNVESMKASAFSGTEDVVKDDDSSFSFDSLKDYIPFLGSDDAAEIDTSGVQDLSNDVSNTGSDIKNEASDSIGSKIEKAKKLKDNFDTLDSLLDALP